MNQRGKKSAAALAVVSTDVACPLQPPSSLTPAQRQVWLRTVNAKPADWFGEEHVPLLMGYCRHVCNADTIDEALSQVKADWLLSEDGIARHERLYKMHDREERAASALATRLRLTPHSVTDSRVAGRKAARHTASEDHPWHKSAKSR